jgi:hypothetical protein
LLHSRHDIGRTQVHPLSGSSAAGYQVRAHNLLVVIPNEAPRS